MKSNTASRPARGVPSVTLGTTPLVRLDRIGKGLFA